MANEQYGRLTNPEQWQEGLSPDLFEALTEWIKSQPFDLTLRSWLTSGRSGSHVAIVWLRPDKGMLQQAVLKLVPSHLGAAESRRVGLAKQHVPPSFFVAHMIETRWAMPLPGSDWYIHLQEMAQEDLARLVPMAELIDDARFGEYCEIVLRAIVDELNSGNDDPMPLHIGIGDFLRQDIGHKRVELEKFLSDVGLSATGADPEIRLPGRPDPLPNPIAVLAGATDAGSVDVFRGNGHGDLHLQNILIPATPRPDPTKFRLIDLGRFSSDTPVSRDPMKLLLSVSRAWLPGLTPRSAARSSLAELIVRPRSYTPAPPVAGYLEVARKIHEAAGSWGIRRGLSADWVRQNLVVLAAAALRTVADPTLSQDDRWWHLEVAALCVDGLLAREESDRRMLANTPPSALRTERGSEVSHAHRAPEAEAPANPGLMKVRFCRVVGDSWEELADVVLIRPDERQGFRRGKEAREIWDWLEIRGRLDELRGAVLAIERPDLARILDGE